MLNIDLINRVLIINRGEWPKVFLLSAHFFFTTTVLVIVQSIMTALFLGSYSVTLLPYLFASQALVCTGVSLMYTLFIGKISMKTETASIISLFIVSILFARFFLIYDQKWFIFVLYIWLQTLIDLLTVQSGILVMNSLNTREAKRLFPLVNAGGPAGAFAGGIAVSSLSIALGSENLIVFCVPFLTAMLFTSSYIIKLYADGDKQSESASLNRGHSLMHTIKDVLSDIFKEKLLRIFLIVFSSVIIASTIIDYQFQFILKENYSKDQIATFLGLFVVTLNIFSLIIQLFVANRLLIYLGLITNLLLMPIFLIVGSSVFLFLPIIWVVMGTKFMENVCKYSVYKASSNLIYMPFSPLKRSRLRIITGGVIKPLCVLVASFILILLTKAVEFKYLSLLVITVGIAGVLSGIKLKKPYVEKLKDSLSNRRMKLKDIPELSGIIDKDGKKIIEKSLASEDKNYVLFSLELIRENIIPVDVDKVEELYKHSDSDIRMEALKTVRFIGTKKDVSKITSFLEGPSSLEDKSECIRTLRHLGGDDLSSLVYNYVNSSFLYLKGEALVYLLSSGNQNSSNEAAERLKKLQSSNNSEDQMAAAYVVGELARDTYTEYLMPLLESSILEVRREAIIAVGKLRSPLLLEMTVKSLSERKLLSNARKSIIGYGKDAVPVLMRIYKSSENNISLNLEILAILSKIPCRKSVAALVEALFNSEEKLRQQALHSLNKLNDSLKIMHEFKDLILESLDKEIYRGCRIFTLHSLTSEDKEAENVFSSQGTSILEKELMHKIAQLRENIFRFLGLLHNNQSVIYQAYFNYISANSKLRANSLELLDNIIDKDVLRRIIVLLEEMSPTNRLAALKGKCKIPDDGLKAVLEDDDKWLRSVALWLMEKMPNKKITGLKRMEVKMYQIIERIFFLKSVPMFSSLSGEELKPMAEIFSETTRVKGNVIFKEGDSSDNFYLILSGKLKVESAGKEIATLRKGDYFGEMALLDKEPRSATVKVLEDCDLLELGRGDFHEILEEYPKLSFVILGTLSKRIRTLILSM